MRILASALLAALALAPSGSARPFENLSAALGIVEGRLQPDLNGTSIEEIRRLFAEPPADSRIMMRWWWFGPSATREELDAEMRRMKEGGIGGFEVAVVYPLAVDDPKTGFHNYAVPLDGVPRPDCLHVQESARARAADGPHDRQRLVVRRTAHHARSRREPPALGTPGNRRGCHEHRASGTLRSRRAHRRVHRTRLDAGGRCGGVPAAGDSRARPDSVAAGSGATRRAVVLRGPDGPGRQACRRRRRRLRARSLQPHGDCHTSARSGGQAAERRCARLDRFRVLRQPRGLRRRLDHRTLSGVPATPRLRSAPAAADRRAWQRRARRRGAARLRPHPDRAVRRALPRAGTRVGLEEPRAVPDPELRPAAGDGWRATAARTSSTAKGSSGDRCRRRGGPHPPRTSLANR